MLIYLLYAYRFKHTFSFGIASKLVCKVIKLLGPSFEMAKACILK